jgi:pyrroloquinoline quinone biosynthesis protein B
VNASPDLRLQLTQFRSEPACGTRGTPIAAILLTDADLDHVLGLFLLRENKSSPPIHTSEGIRRIVEKGLRVTEILYSYCNVQWIVAPSTFARLYLEDGMDSGFEYKAIQIEGHYPRYWKSASRIDCRLIYILRERATGKSILVAPAVVRLEPQLLMEMSQADIILFDGTLWSNQDFEKSGVPSRLVDELLQSHLPILDGSLEALALQAAKHKAYIHINNTNPILWENSPERQLLNSSGIHVARDGMTFCL